MHVLAERPLLTALNRVERFYSGGKLLDQWQGVSPPSDNHMSEELLLSTIEYRGTGYPAENGISRVVLPDGSYENLRSLIAKDPKAFLGESYAGYEHSGVQARAGYSTTRLMVQCHPDDPKARDLFKAPFGKTEAWYIAGTRAINGEKAHVYCGFKKGITRERWEKLFETQDITGMLESLHRFEVQKGDCVLVNAGCPHAIGSGCLFIELHEPCDLTLRTERNFNAMHIPDEHLHFGAGFKALFDCFDYTSYEREEVTAKMFKKLQLEQTQPGGALYTLIDYEDSSCFVMKKLDVNGKYMMPVFNGHYIFVSLKGSFLFHFGKETLQVPQGRCVFVPAGCSDLHISGKGEGIVGYPFKISDSA
jgi:mannose-6-phosphate isomerase